MNRATVTWVLLLLLALTISGKWRGTRILYSGADVAGKAFAHINVDTGVVHSFGTSGGTIIHRTFRGHLGPVNTITSQSKVSYIDATNTKHTAALAEEADEQIVVLTYESTRSNKDSKECTKDHTEGCAEVYIVESKNDGITWTKPVVIQRAAQNDQVHRRKPCVTYDRDTDVLYIMYTRIETTTGLTSLAMVTQAVGDAGFSREILLKIPGRYKKAMDPKVAITIPHKGHSEIHVVFVAELDNYNQTVYYTKSTDHGATWSMPRDMIPHDHQPEHYGAISAVTIAGLNELFAVYSEKQGADIMFVSSKDGGENWTQPHKVNIKPSVVPFIRACGQTRTLGVLFSMFGEKGIKSYEMLYFNNTDGSFTQIPSPFGDMPELSHIPMAECTGLVDPDVKFIAVAGSRSSVVFDDYDYDLPDTQAHA